MNTLKIFDPNLKPEIELIACVSPATHCMRMCVEPDMPKMSGVLVLGAQLHRVEKVLAQRVRGCNVFSLASF